MVTSPTLSKIHGKLSFIYSKSTISFFIKSNNILVKILIFVFIIVAIAIGVVVANNYFNLGFF